MNSLEIEKQIMTRLLAYPNLDKSRVARANVNFTPPTTGIWMRPSVLGGINTTSSIGSQPCLRENGTFAIQIFDREGNGTGAIKAFADSLAKHFAYYQTLNLELLEPSIVNVGIDERGFYQMNLLIPYRFN